jgi:hypothetical protein
LGNVKLLVLSSKEKVELDELVIEIRQIMKALSNIILEELLFLVNTLL